MPELGQIGLPRVLVPNCIPYGNNLCFLTHPTGPGGWATPKSTSRSSVEGDGQPGMESNRTVSPEDKKADPQQIRG